MTETYRTVTTRFRGIAPSGKAFFVDKPRHRPQRDWAVIPRSLIHGADDRTMDGLFVGEEVTFRLIDWKAEELGFA